MFISSQPNHPANSAKKDTAMMTKTNWTLISTLTMTLCTGAVQAAFVTPQIWTRGVGGTTFQHWDVFTTMTDATPDVANINPNGTARVSETSGGAFITGGGNIYGFNVPFAMSVTIPELDVPTPAHNVTAIVQIRVQGQELDTNSLLLNGLAAINYAELSRDQLGGFGGAKVDHWFLFNIPYNLFGDGIPGVQNLTLTFAAEAAHTSLDQLAIDTAVRPFGYYSEPNPIPEPTSIALLGLGGLMLLRRRAV